MAVYKCKMCGAPLTITEGVSVVECEYCGTSQTVPTADSEKKMTLFGRANRLRMACEFDKAAGVYESIVAEFPIEAEAYWGLVLCKYGIEYVDDPATGKKVPTCHRSSFDSVMEDSDFEQACENADPIARRVYREEAKAIDLIQKGILEVSGKEEPYDIFICYKETAEDGQRTVDSVIAQEVYDALTEKGYRVFFSRITLEDKLGTEYEPYIFAALNSAKIMLAFGTDYEHFNAVWVKNEWSRFLALIAAGQKKTLIPCYKGIDAYDMPKEFAHLQGQDMGKVGAIQDLLRGIEKILGKSAETQTTPAAPAQTAGGPTVDSLLKRGQLFLGDGDWTQADTYFDKVLDIDPENAEAYLGKFCVMREYRQVSQLAGDIKVFSEKESQMWERALGFASPELRAEWEAVKQKQSDASGQKADRLASIRKAAQGLLVVTNNRTIGIRSDGTVLDGDGLCSGWRNIVAVCSDTYHVVGLRADGTVVAAVRNKEKDDCGQCNVSGWQDIVAIDAAYGLTFGLRSDGTVVSAGEGSSLSPGQNRVSGWRNITAICAGGDCTYGLRADGTVVAAGKNEHGECNVFGWTDIVAVSAGYYYVVGLRADGTVVAAGENTNGQCDVSGWTDIVAVSAGDDCTVGLRSDGTVVAAGKDNFGRLFNVSGWRDIVAVDTNGNTVVGLRSNGTLVITPVVQFKYAGSDWSEWQDIVAVYIRGSSSGGELVGLRADGTVLSVDKNMGKTTHVFKKRLFDNAETLAEEREKLRRRGEELKQKKAEERARREAEERARRAREEQARKEAKERARKEAKERARQRRAELEAERTALKTELANLRGLFTGKRRREIEARLAEIEAELKKL